MIYEPFLGFQNINHLLILCLLLVSKILIIVLICHLLILYKYIKYVQ